MLIQLNDIEKIDLIKAFDNLDEPTVFRLVGKALGSCSTCMTWNYCKTWIGYWFETNQLIR